MPPALSPDAFRPVVLVLASGRGARFRASGGAVHKLRALLAGRSVLDRTLDAVKASGLPWHVEDAGHPGMGDAIAAAVRATRGAPGWLVLPGDLPLVAPATLRAVADALALRPDGAVLPWVAGTRAHPVGFGAASGPQLEALSGDEGARRVLRALEAAGAVAALTLEDAGATLDIDTVADLAEAERRLAAAAAPSLNGG